MNLLLLSYLVFIIMNHVYVHYVRKGGSKTGYKNSTARFFVTAQMCTAAVAPALCEPSNACGHRWPKFCSADPAGDSLVLQTHLSQGPKTENMGH